MNKRGSAFGAFNGVYGVAWFLGSVAMGLLYDRSLVCVGGCLECWPNWLRRCSSSGCANLWPRRRRQRTSGGE